MKDDLTDEEIDAMLAQAEERNRRFAIDPERPHIVHRLVNNSIACGAELGVSLLGAPKVYCPTCFPEKEISMTMDEMHIRRCLRVDGTVLLRMVETDSNPLRYTWPEEGQPPGVLIWDRDGVPEWVDFGNGESGTWEACKSDPRLRGYTPETEPEG